MTQLSLFGGASETVLVDDERGRVSYTPDFLKTNEARAWFTELRDSVQWKS